MKSIATLFANTAFLSQSAYKTIINPLNARLHFSEGQKLNDEILSLQDKLKTYLAAPINNWQKANYTQSSNSKYFIQNDLVTSVKNTIDTIDYLNKPDLTIKLNLLISGKFQENHKKLFETTGLDFNDLKNLNKKSPLEQLVSDIINNKSSDQDDFKKKIDLLDKHIKEKKKLYSREDKIEILLETNEEGNTVAHYACKYMKVDFIKTLSEILNEKKMSECARLVNEGGKTPLDLAIQEIHDKNYDTKLISQAALMHGLGMKLYHDPDIFNKTKTNGRENDFDWLVKGTTPECGQGFLKDLKKATIELRALAESIIKTPIDDEEGVNKAIIKLNEFIRTNQKFCSRDNSIDILLESNTGGNNVAHYACKYLNIDFFENLAKACNGKIPELLKYSANTSGRSPLDLAIESWKGKFNMLLISSAKDDAMGKIEKMQQLGLDFYIDKTIYIEGSAKFREQSDRVYGKDSIFDPQEVIKKFREQINKTRDEKAILNQKLTEIKTDTVSPDTNKSTQKDEDQIQAIKPLEEGQNSAPLTDKFLKFLGYKPSDYIRDSAEKIFFKLTGPCEQLRKFESCVKVAKRQLWDEKLFPLLDQIESDLDQIAFELPSELTNQAKKKLSGKIIECQNNFKKHDQLGQDFCPKLLPTLKTKLAKLTLDLDKTDVEAKAIQKNLKEISSFFKNQMAQLSLEYERPDKTDIKELYTINDLCQHLDFLKDPECNVEELMHLKFDIGFTGETTVPSYGYAAAAA